MDSTNQTANTQEIPAILKNGMLKKQPRWKTFLQNTVGEYGYLLFAALIPMVLFYLMYLITQQLYPFGDGTVLVLDLNGQYVSFYEGLHDILRGEADLLTPSHGTWAVSSSVSTTTT